MAGAGLSICEMTGGIFDGGFPLPDGGFPGFDGGFPF
jgi:hypothetical protein